MPHKQPVTQPTTQPGADPPGDATDLDPVATLDRAILLAVTLQSRTAAETALAAALHLSSAEAAAIMATAYSRVLSAALVDFEAQRGTALIRLNDLYERSLRVQDCKTALAAQRELNRLLRLDHAFGAAPRPAAEPRAHDESPPETAPQPPKSPLSGLRLIG